MCVCLCCLSFVVAMGVNFDILRLRNMQMVEFTVGQSAATDYCNSYPGACSNYNISVYSTYYEPVFYAGMELILWYVFLFYICLTYKVMMVCAV